MLYVTADALAGFPSIAGLSPAEQDIVLADAATVETQIAGHPFTTDGDLRVWGERAGLDAARLNVALAFLRESDRVRSLSPAVGAAAPQIAVRAPGAPLPLDLEAKTVDELKALAKERNIEGFSTLKKSELIAALLSPKAAA